MHGIPAINSNFFPFAFLRHRHMEPCLRRHSQRAHHGRRGDGAGGLPDATRLGQEHGKVEEG